MRLRAAEKGPKGQADSRAPSRTAVFIDRDGVINEERRDYVTDWREFRFLPGAVEALVALSRAGFDVFVVSNQSAIHRGLVSLADVRRLHQHMVATIRRAGGQIRGVYVCPHTPEEACTCRKPQPGLLLRAAADYGLDLSRCYLIGDKLSDMEAGHSVGCRCILVLTGLDVPPFAGQPPAGIGARYRTCPSIREAVALLLQDEAATPRSATAGLASVGPVVD